MKNLSIKTRIKSMYREMNQTEKKIADYVLSNAKIISRNSISDVAKELQLADSTFFQFTKKLGYNGFKDFKIALLTEEFDLNISIHEKINKTDNEQAIVDKVFASSIKAIEDTASLTDINTIKKATKMLIESRKVCFIGLGGSNAVALDSYHKFLRSPVNVIYNSDAHIQRMNVSLLNEKDCAFVISHTGLSVDAIEIAKLAKENGAKIIALTSYPLSPLAQIADVILLSTSEEISYRSESLSSRLSQLSIIDALFVMVMINNDKKSSQSLQKIRNAISLTKE